MTESCKWCGNELANAEHTELRVGTGESAETLVTCCSLGCMEFWILRENPAELDLPLEMLPAEVAVPPDAYDDDQKPCPESASERD